MIESKNNLIRVFLKFQFHKVSVIRNQIMLITFDLSSGFGILRTIVN